MINEKEKAEFDNVKVLAEKGDAGMQFELAEMYMTGENSNGDPCVEENYEEAEKWYLKAAMQGNTKAMLILTEEYYDGRFGGPETKAYIWCNVAYKFGDMESLDRLDDLKNGMELYETDESLKKANEEIDRLFNSIKTK